MKDIYRNPIFYYILVPIVAALWPLLAWMVYLPKAKESVKEDVFQCKKAQQVITQILNLDPDRLELVDPNKDAVEFDYARDVVRIATRCQIAPANYTISSKPVRIKSGQKTQSAMVILKEVDIIKIARFLSTIQLRWAGLQCENLTLTKKKNLPDTWDVDLDFKYYY